VWEVLYGFYLQFTPLFNGERILKIGEVLAQLSPSVGGPFFGNTVYYPNYNSEDNNNFWKPL